MIFFPEHYTHSKSKIEVELDLPNYAKTSDLIMQKTQQVLIYQILLKRLISLA